MNKSAIRKVEDCARTAATFALGLLTFAGLSGLNVTQTFLNFFHSNADANEVRAMVLGKLFVATLVATIILIVLLIVLHIMHRKDEPEKTIDDLYQLLNTKTFCHYPSVSSTEEQSEQAGPNPTENTETTGEDSTKSRKNAE